jgi:hypothetical protein
MTDRAVQPEAPTRRIKYSVGEYIWAEATNVTPAKAHAMADEIDRWYEVRAASQERPQPDDVIALGRLLGRVQQMYEDWPTLDMEIEADIAQAKAAIEDAGVAQERPEDIAGDLWHQEEGWHSPGVAQERPPSRGWKTPGDPSIDGTDFPSQEWPSIDVERLHRELWAEFGEMLSDDEYASIERIVARLTGGSVASPEPSDG